MKGAWTEGDGGRVQKEHLAPLWVSHVSNAARQTMVAKVRSDLSDRNKRSCGKEEAQRSNLLVTWIETVMCR